jgi:hypothetical protein
LRGLPISISREENSIFADGEKMREESFFTLAVHAGEDLSKHDGAISVPVYNASVADERQKFVEGIDYYFESGLMILTERFLLERGYCCGNGCRNCPYTAKTRKENTHSK